ncbi:hypothetical protein GQ607_002565 [Colletotrichum asianum]|uniref:Uncharacterized protein n=1 Tax=Colletotrichum asianum TaxID=702518 RepID=A0A8H3ZYD3_9PEZI|nr:hypothetical protein GQ607_002565 [Colletotrichum asianum]
MFATRPWSLLAKRLMILGSTAYAWEPRWNWCKHSIDGSVYRSVEEEEVARHEAFAEDLRSARRLDAANHKPAAREAFS